MRRLVLAALVWSSASSVLAQPAPNAEAEYERGRALRAQHRDVEAMAVFRTLYELNRSGRALAQVALAEAAQGRWVDAEAHLVESFSLPTDDWMRSNLHGGLNLMAVLETVREHLGSLEVTSNTPGAELWVGERHIGAFPLDRPVRVVAGGVSIVVRAPGHADVARVVTVTSGGFARESVDLALARPVPSADPARVIAVRPLAQAHPARVVSPSVTSPLRVAAWATAGAGLLSVAVGGVGLAVGTSAASRWNNDDQCLPTNGAARASACASELDTAETMRPLAIGGLLVGGALAITSAVLFVVSRPGAARSMAATCAPNFHEVGLFCEARF